MIYLVADLLFLALVGAMTLYVVKQARSLWGRRVKP